MPSLKSSSELKKQTASVKRRISGKLSKGGDMSALDALASARVAIEGVNIEIDGGRFPAKTVAGRPKLIEADIFADGHDKIAAALRYRKRGERKFEEVRFAPVINDRWAATMVFPENAFYEVVIVAWRDLYATWCMEVKKKHDAGVDISLELTEARHLLEAAVASGNKPHRDDKALLRDILKQDGKRETRSSGFRSSSPRRRSRRCGAPRPAPISPNTRRCGSSPTGRRRRSAPGTRSSRARCRAIRRGTAPSTT